MSAAAGVATSAADLARQTWVLAGRDLRATLTRSAATQLVVSPLVFLVAFYAVFHRLLAARGVAYEQFLPPAIVVQSMMVLAISTAFFVASERRSGLLVRWRCMPISRAAVPLSRLATDALRAALSIAAVLAAAHVAGFRFTGGPAAAVAFVVLAIAFALTLAAGTAALGLASRNPEGVAALLALPYLPLLTLSTAFVPADAFPGWLQPAVEASPVSAVVDALRALAGSGAAPRVWHAAAWLVALAILFLTLAVRAFRRPVP